MSKFYIIKAGTTFPEVSRIHGDFDLWTINAMGISPDDAIVIDIQKNEPLPVPQKCRGVVITGSHAMVTDHLPWSDRILEWIPGIIKEKIPFFGICYGHQLLAEAMGGHVGFHPGGKEIGTVDIVLSPAGSRDPLFKAMPGHFPVHVTHSQCVIGLPPGAVLLARNDFEPCHAFRLGSCAWGVQFHPEYNIDIMNGYIIQQSDELKTYGRNIDYIMAAVKETPEAADLMKRFVVFTNN
jgi:GMP synthase (glutamine-hydrolysing)